MARAFILVILLIPSAFAHADSLQGSWEVTSGCSASSYPGSEMSFSARKKNGLMTSNAKCQRTPRRFIKVSVPSTTGGTAYGQTFYGVHTGEFFILPPIQNTEFQPLFSVNTACPLSNKPVNWLYVQWNDGAVSLNNTYLLGTADIHTTGSILLRTQYDLNGSLYWGGSQLMAGDPCVDGVNDIQGAGNLGGRVFWTANDGGVFKTGPGKATFFLPSETVPVERLGNLTFEGITFDSSTSTFGLYGNAIGDIRYLMATSGADGRTFTLRPLSNPETGDLDTGPLSYTDSVTLTSINFPKPGMMLGQVTRTGTAAVCSTPPCTGNVACIARTSGSSGFRLLCSGQSPIDNTIPYHFTLFRPYDCPAGYVRVPKDTAVGVLDDVCVAKYEMKNVGGAAVSQAAGTPWVNIDRAGAIAACRAVGPGYDLITNAEWQATARNIEDAYRDGKYLNWSNGSKYNANALQKGHSDGVPAALLSASDDEDPCAGTGNLGCADRKHDDFFQRRTFQLSTGGVLWDIAGNAAEWVRTPNWTVQGTNGFIALETFNPGSKIKWGARGNYTASGTYPKTSVPYGNLGRGFYSAKGGIIRGGAHPWGDQIGLFYTGSVFETLTTPDVGFRCVYHSAPVTDAAVLFFAPSSYAFGTVNLNTSATSGDIVLYNEGNGPATLASPRFTATGAFTVASTTCPTGGAVLQSGASCTITVRFTPTAIGAAAGTITANWTSAGLTGAQNNSLSLTGTGAIPAAQGTMFVSSALFTVPGNTDTQFTGIAGADAQCQRLADLANLGAGRRWRALLSDSTTSARDRIDYDTVFKTVTGVKLADNKADLVDQSLDSKLNVDEYGQTVPDTSSTNSVWTGSYYDVSNRSGASLHCSNWTNAGGTAWRGVARLNNQAWIYTNNGTCGSTPSRIYCFDSNY